MFKIIKKQPFSFSPYQAPGGPPGAGLRSDPEWNPWGAAPRFYGKGVLEVEGWRQRWRRGQRDRWRQRETKTGTDTHSHKGKLKRNLWIDQ